MRIIKNILVIFLFLLSAVLVVSCSGEKPDNGDIPHSDYDGVVDTPNAGAAKGSIVDTPRTGGNSSPFTSSIVDTTRNDGNDSP